MAASPPTIPHPELLLMIDAAALLDHRGQGELRGHQESGFQVDCQFAGPIPLRCNPVWYGG